jgi:hypothetical protein
MHSVVLSKAMFVISKINYVAISTNKVTIIDV